MTENWCWAAESSAAQPEEIGRNMDAAVEITGRGEQKEMIKRERRKKAVFGIVSYVLACLLMTGCGSDTDSVQDIVAEDIPEAEMGKNFGNEVKPQPGGGKTAEESGEEVPSYLKGIETTYPKGNKIKSQTFDVSLEPFGEVTFASYEPDTSQNSFADAVFLIEKDGKALAQLPGVSGDNSTLELFEQVEAVSFPDYNRDGFDDIIIICSYCLGAGPQAGQPHSVIRYYTGSGEGKFTYEEEMSQNATGALSVISIETAKSFIGCQEESVGEASGENGLPDVFPLDFSFMSGAGGWATSLTMNRDGSFEGSYHDSDMGDTGEGYPNGTIYICAFKGRFDEIKKINEYTYSMTLGEITTENGTDETWIEDDILWVASGPYGLEDGKEFLFYTPGAPMKELPEEFLSWWQYARGSEYPETLSGYGIYNKKMGYGFFTN